MDYKVFYTKHSPWSMHGGGFIEIAEGETPQDDALATYGKDVPRNIFLEVADLILTSGENDDGNPSKTLSGTGSTKPRYDKGWHDGNDHHCDRFSVLGSRTKTTDIRVTIHCGSSDNFEENQTSGLGVSLGAVRFDDSEDSLRGFLEGPHIWCEVFVSPESFDKMQALILEYRDLNPLLRINFSTQEDVYLSWDPIGGLPREIKLLASQRDITNADEIPEGFFSGDKFGFNKNFGTLNSWSVTTSTAHSATVNQAISSSDNNESEDAPAFSADHLGNISDELAQVQVALAQIKQQVSMAVWKGVFGGVLMTMIVAAVLFIV